MNSQSVGISAIATYVPRHYLELNNEWVETFAHQSGKETVDRLRNKISQGIGILKVALPDFHEDAATMAANAVRKLINQTGIDPTQISSIAVGTESGVDMSKSMASSVLGMIERYYHVDLSHVSCPQFQFACIGATYALEAALRTLKAGTDEFPFHIVVATDIAKYPIGSTGEPTQGAGAVAMLVTTNPRLLSIDLATVGTCTRDENDFFRPVFARSAVVDGKRSISVYCDAMEKATEYFLRRNEPCELVFDHFGAFVFHVPFPKMAEYAAVRLFRTLWRQDPHYAKLMLSIQSDNLHKEELSLRRSPVFRALFDEKVKPSLYLPEIVGNIYSGSLYLALVSLIENQSGPSSLAGKDILLASYGSGASAKVFRATFNTHFLEHYKDNLTQELRDNHEGGNRYRVDIAQYTRLHSPIELTYDSKYSEISIGEKEILPVIHSEGAPPVFLAQRPTSILPPNNEFYLREIGTKIGIDGSNIGYRYYDFASPTHNSERNGIF